MSIFGGLFKKNECSFVGFEHPLINSQDIGIKSQIDTNLELIVKVPFAASTKYYEILSSITTYAKTKYNIENINCEFTLDIKPHKIKQGLKRLNAIKNMIAVTAGKGGVGKSTTAINLAIALANNGASVGLFDCDLYGPSIPMLMGESGYKPSVQNNLFVPLDKYGIKVMSFGFLVAPSQPTIWRGAMVNKAIDQLLMDSNWGELDYLIIDMPPGTGDIHLTMSQKMPLTATVVVTTPQDIALIDVTKSIEMFKQLDIPCIGIVENMSTHICDKCGNQLQLFGHGAGDKLVQNYQYPLLAKLPLDVNICKQSDSGLPIALEQNSIAEIYNELALNVGLNLAKLPKDYSSKLSSIPLSAK